MTLDHASGRRRPRARGHLGLSFSSIRGFVLAPAASGSTKTSLQALSDDGGTSPATVSQLYALQNDGTMTVVSVAEVPDGGTIATSAQIRPLGAHDTVKYTLLQYSVLGGDDLCGRPRPCP